MNINNYNQAQLQERLNVLQDRYETFKEANYSLDLTRGKPGPDQLNLSNELDGILKGFYLLQDGTDVRNYGGILGIPEARQLGAQLLGVDYRNVLVGGNSSLFMMYSLVAHMMPRWLATTDTIKFICPVPGYDRHFNICEYFNIEMITVPLNDDGPDMDEIFRLCEADSDIKGIWCVPQYSNPTGHTYGPGTVQRFAELGKVAGDDFRILWDNAYAVHHLNDTPDQLGNLMDICLEIGTEDSVVMLTSTSKITFAGAGISFLALSTANLSAFEEFLAPQIINFDKVNQLRHVRFLKDLEHINDHMRKHRDITGPRFELVETRLSNGLQGKGIATWTRPNGGYFVSLDTTFGVADRVVDLAAGLGVKLTPAGSTFPYGQDPNNSNIRIAPTYPSMSELGQALDVLVLCIELASIEHATGE